MGITPVRVTSDRQPHPGEEHRGRYDRAQDERRFRRFFGGRVAGDRAIPLLRLRLRDHDPRGAAGLPDVLGRVLGSDALDAANRLERLQEPEPLRTAERLALTRWMIDS